VRGNGHDAEAFTVLEKQGPRKVLGQNVSDILGAGDLLDVHKLVADVLANDVITHTDMAGTSVVVGVVVGKGSRSRVVRVERGRARLLVAQVSHHPAKPHDGEGGSRESHVLSLESRDRRALLRVATPRDRREVVVDVEQTEDKTASGAGVLLVVGKSCVGVSNEACRTTTERSSEAEGEVLAAALGKVREDRDDPEVVVLRAGAGSVLRYLLERIASLRVTARVREHSRAELVRDLEELCSTALRVAVSAHRLGELARRAGSVLGLDVGEIGVAGARVLVEAAKREVDLLGRLVAEDFDAKRERQCSFFLDLEARSERRLEVLVVLGRASTQVQAWISST
jgi:hypothetical protein